jgi:hypothetical protein
MNRKNHHETTRAREYRRTPIHNLAHTLLSGLAMAGFVVSATWWLMAL